MQLSGKGTLLLAVAAAVGLLAVSAAASAGPHASAIASGGHWTVAASSGGISVARLEVRTKTGAAPRVRASGPPASTVVAVGGLARIDRHRFVVLVAVINRKGPATPASFTFRIQGKAAKRSRLIAARDINDRPFPDQRAFGPFLAARPGAAKIARRATASYLARGGAAYRSTAARLSAKSLLEKSIEATIAGAELAEAPDEQADAARARQDTIIGQIEDAVGGNLKGGSANTPPQAQFGFSPNDPPHAPKTAQQVAFDASQLARDSDGTVVFYEWDFGDATKVQTSLTDVRDKVSHAFGRPGVYTVTLRVMDDEGAQAASSQSVYVSGPGKSTGTSNPFSCPTDAGDSRGIEWWFYIPHYAERPRATLPNPCPGTTQTLALEPRVEPGNSKGYIDAWGNPMDTFHFKVRWEGPGTGAQVTEDVTVEWD